MKKILLLHRFFRFLFTFSFFVLFYFLANDAVIGSTKTSKSQITYYFSSLEVQVWNYCCSCCRV